MTVQLRALAIGAVFGLGVAIATSSWAEEMKPTGEFGWFGVGTAHVIEEGHVYWVGEFSGTFFADDGDASPMHRAAVKCPAFNDLDFNKNESGAGGYCIVTDGDGDIAYLSWQIPWSEGTVTGDGTFEWTGGTGKYDGITGTNTFTGVTTVNHADGTASGYAIWNR